MNTAVTNPADVLIELEKAISEARDMFELRTKDLCVVARSEVLRYLRRIDGFPSIAVCPDDDIPRITGKKGAYTSTAYIVPRMGPSEAIMTALANRKAAREA